jgi:hypothetical protein
MKMVLLGVIALLLILGGVYGAATFGFLDIPGVSPYKHQSDSRVSKHLCPPHAKADGPGPGDRGGKAEGTQSQ